MKIFLFFFFTGTEERDEPKNNYKVIPLLSIMPCINILFLLFLFMIFLSHIKRYIVYIFLPKVLPFCVSFGDYENIRNNEGNA